MKSDKRTGFVAGYKKAGPTLKFTIWVAAVGLILSFIYFVIQFRTGATEEQLEQAHVDRYTKHTEQLEKLNEVKNIIQRDPTFFNNREAVESIKSYVKQVDSDRPVFMVKGEEVFPEEGKVYPVEGNGKKKVSYMYKDGLIYVEWTTEDGLTGYNVIDRKGGKIYDSKLPFPLEEYVVEIPPQLEVRRQTQIIGNGYKKITITLKWDHRWDIIRDSQGKLQQLSIRGPAHIDNRNKIISARVPTL